jgi:hypothetical protein
LSAIFSSKEEGGRMKDECHLLPFCLIPFGFFRLIEAIFHFRDDGDENRGEFICFFDERFEFFGFDDF